MSGYLKSIHPTNVLSFGPSTKPLELSALNVFIGANGSGKSNLLEILGFLQGAPRELSVAPREGGGVTNWLWKGSKHPTATIETKWARLDKKERAPLRHSLSFTEHAQRLQVTDERIEDTEITDKSKTKPIFYFGYEDGKPYLNVRTDPEPQGLFSESHPTVTSTRKRKLVKESIDSQRSILSQRIDPDHYPEITSLAVLCSGIALYREWSMGKSTIVRVPQPADLPNHVLMEDGRNLGLIISKIRRDSLGRKQLKHYLKQFYEDVEDIDVQVEGGTVQIFLVEQSFTIPATRLSDGTLRWICLLAVLLNPTPSHLICIEEPELGLHPDIMPSLAELLIEASKRSQLLITTHSEHLIDALGEIPQSVVVCEKREGATEFHRLEKQELDSWLKEYSLGTLWRKGEIGGTRW